MTIEELEAKITDNQTKIDLKIEYDNIEREYNERVANAQAILDEALAYKSVVQGYLADARAQLSASIVASSPQIINYESDSHYERVSYRCSECDELVKVRYDLGDKIESSWVCGVCDTIRYIATVRATHDAEGHKFSVGCRFCWGPERLEN